MVSKALRVTQEIQVLLDNQEILGPLVYRVLQAPVGPQDLLEDQEGQEPRVLEDLMVHQEQQDQLDQQETLGHQDKMVYLERQETQGPRVSPVYPVL